MKSNHYWNPKNPGEGFSLYFFEDGNVWGQFYDKHGWLGIYGKDGQTLKVFELDNGTEMPAGTATITDKGDSLEIRHTDIEGEEMVYLVVPLFDSAVLVDDEPPATNPVKIEKHLVGTKWVEVPVPLLGEFEVNHDHIQSRKKVGKYRVVGDAPTLHTSTSGKHNPDIEIQGNEITLYLGPTTSDSPVTAAHFIVSTDSEILNLSAKVTKA